MLQNGDLQYRRRVLYNRCTGLVRAVPTLLKTPKVCSSELSVEVLFFSQQHCFFPEKLWCAPEILRHPESARTKESDIYSMGIIVQEITTRGGPFEKEAVHLTPQGNDLPVV